MSLELLDLDRDGRLEIVATDRNGPRRGLLWLCHPEPVAGGMTR